MSNDGCGQNSLSLLLLLLHVLPLLQHRILLMGDSTSQTSPGGILFMGCSSLRTALACVLTTRHSLSGMTSPMWISPQGHRPCWKSCSCVGYSPWAWSLPGSCSKVGSSVGCSVDICSNMIFPMGCTGTIYFACRGCKGKSTPVPGASPPRFFSACVSAGLFQFFVIISLSHSCCVAFFCSFLNMFTRTQHHLG